LFPCDACVFLNNSFAGALEPIPDKLVVLTFDDASKSHFTVVRPLLKKHGFGATFFVTEASIFPPTGVTTCRGKKSPNSTRMVSRSATTPAITWLSPTKPCETWPPRCAASTIVARNTRFRFRSASPIPGNALSKAALPILKDLGTRFARRGGSPEYPYKDGRGFAYEPGLDHPLLIPSAGDARPAWNLDDFKSAVNQAKHGKIAVLQFHGVPDTAHDWVTSSKEQFEGYLKYLADHRFRVIALRDLAKYVDADIAPSNPSGVIEDRQRQLAAGKLEFNSRPAKNDTDLRYWLENMATHRFTTSEMSAVLD